MKPANDSFIRPIVACSALAAQPYVAKFLQTFKGYPPRMKASFSLDQVMKKLESSGGSK